MTRPHAKNNHETHDPLSTCFTVYIYIQPHGSDRLLADRGHLIELPAALSTHRITGTYVPINPSISCQPRALCNVPGQSARAPTEYELNPQLMALTAVT